LNIEPDNVSIILYDAMGKIIRFMKINNTFDRLVVPSGDIPSGTYIGILKNSDKPLGTVKFVIAK